MAFDTRKTTTLLTELSEIDAPSGFEEPMARYLAGKLRGAGFAVSTDAMGNVLGQRISGKPNAARLLIDAHMDEIGLIITGKADRDGFLRFAAIGSVDPALLPGRRVKLLTEPPVFGVIPILPPHVKKEKNSVSMNELSIDTGGLPFSEDFLGAPAVLCAESGLLGDGAFFGKALDNRLSVAAILTAIDELKETLPANDITVTFSVQEELGLRGAHPASTAAPCDYAIIADADFAEQPGLSSDRTRKFGGGVTIARGPNMNRGFTDTLVSLADSAEIPYQISVEPGRSGTNAEVLQLSGGGVRTALLGTAVKNMHSPVETAELGDALALSQLIFAAMTTDLEKPAEITFGD
ncbi:MAG: M20/M25/M40 family metallo-hydrolase [Oscillospiraceae bacterium]|jgi:endoglucanase|nr:M20/M25/M40 family metallo-hydrolase [Oscillospiraceae bacterium]